MSATLVSYRASVKSRQMKGSSLLTKKPICALRSVAESVISGLMLSQKV
jgi:hypothetical protein